MKKMEVARDTVRAVGDETEPQKQNVDIRKSVKGGEKMKNYEKKAIERAMDIAINRVERMYPHERLFPFERITYQTATKIAREAVKIAQIRAGRVYDLHTSKEAFEYALSIMGFEIRR